MTIKAVAAAIRGRRAILTQWSEIGLDNWSEWHTRYALIDPIIQALGWDTRSPAECCVEWPRPLGGGKVDYALFGNANMYDIVEGNLAPTIIIDPKGQKPNSPSQLSTVSCQNTPIASRVCIAALRS